MAKEELMEFEGEITELLPEGRFRVRRWRRRRAVAIASALLWFGLVFVGTALASH